MTDLTHESQDREWAEEYVGITVRAPSIEHGEPGREFYYTPEALRSHGRQFPKTVEILVKKLQEVRQEPRDIILPDIG